MTEHITTTSGEPTKLNFAGLDVENLAGKHVYDGQVRATDSGFSHVSQRWFENGTISYEQGLEQIAVEKSRRRDLMLEPSAFAVGEKEGRLVLTTGEGEAFDLSNHAVDGFLGLASKSCKGGMPGTGLFRGLTDAGKYPSADPVKLAVPKNSEPLRECLLQYLATAKQELRPQPYLIRVQDGVVRAFLSEKYRSIENEWYVKQIAEIIPGGRLSHWEKATADTLYGNVLIPDCLLEEEDGGYGGMLSISNCEIGTRRATLLPSIFRAICQNGCIWSQKKGEQFSVVHLGRQDLGILRSRMESHIRNTIALIPAVHTKLMALRQWSLDCNVLQLFAEVTKELRLTAKEGNEFIRQWEQGENAEQTAWAALNALTRAGQKFHPRQWVAVDEYLGSLVIGGEKEWGRIQHRAKGHTQESVTKILSLAS